MTPAQPLFIDPFHAGEFLDRRGCEGRLSDLTHHPVALSDDQVAPCPPRVIVARMLRNLKAIYLGTNDFASALSVQRRLAAASNEPEEQRDLGMICLQLDHPGEAIDPLQAYLAALPDADDAEPVTGLAERRSAAGRKVELNRSSPPGSADLSGCALSPERSRPAQPVRKTLGQGALHIGP